MKKEQSREKPSEEYKAHIREIKKVLFGNFRLRDDKRLEASKAVLGNPWGLEDGAPEVFLFGVTRREYVYTAPKREYVRSRYTIGKMLGRIGKALYLETAPDHAACLMKNVFFRPVVLEFGERTDDEEKSEMVLYAYSGRTPFSLLSILHAIGVFERNLPKHVHRKEKTARAAGRVEKTENNKLSMKATDRKQEE